MLNVDQALATILNHINVLGAEDRPLLKCQGQILAEDLYANINVPGYDSSTLDGYAVRSEDIRDASPSNQSILTITGASRAGGPPAGKLAAGQAVRIMTGAPVPEGADCVVKFEDTDEMERTQKPPGLIGVRQAVPVGANIRQEGSNIENGSLGIARGTPIGPAEINLAASLGHTRMKVIRRPVVAIIATGDELVMPGKELPGGKLYNGNIYSIAAQVQQCGGIPRLIGIARDNRTSLIAKIRKGMEADAIITSGGVSMGDYDLVKDVLADIGEVVFWQVDMAPGKPFAFGIIHDRNQSKGAKTIPHFALTGNPTASMINFEVLVRPALLKMMGNTNQTSPVIEALTEEPIKNKKATRFFTWVQIECRNGCYFAKSSGPRNSSILPATVNADGLAIVPEGKTLVAKGEKLQVIMLNWH